jgi:hypothetical protein
MTPDRKCTTGPGVLGTAILLLAVAGLGVLLRAPVADVPLERDEGEYAYIAQRWLLGETPYQDNFDQKPPGAFALYALILTWLGASPAAIHWGGQIYTLVTAGLLFLLGRKLFSSTVGVIAAALLLVTTTDPSVLGNALNTETVMILPLVAGFLATLKAVEASSGRWALLAGALSAAALLGKQVALFNLVFHFLLVVLLGRQPVKLGLLLAVGVAAVLGPVTAYFALQGALFEYWDCVVGYNLDYASAMPLEFYGGNFWDAFSFIGKQLGPVFVLAGVGLAGLLRSGAKRRPLALAASWLAFSMMGVCTGGFFRTHYFIQMLPPVSLLAAEGACCVARLPGLRRVPGTAHMLAGLCIAFAVWQGSWYYLPGSPALKAYRLYGYNPFPESLDVARYLEAHTAPDEPVFVYGSEPQLYFYAARKSASRYIFVYPLMNANDDTRQRQQQTLRELSARPPRLLVVVNVMASFLPDDETPLDLEDGIDALVRSYELVGVVLPAEDARFRRLVEPDSGTDVWARAVRSVNRTRKAVPALATSTMGLMGSSLGQGPMLAAPAIVAERILRINIAGEHSIAVYRRPPDRTAGRAGSDNAVN